MRPNRPPHRHEVSARSRLLAAGACAWMAAACAGPFAPVPSGDGETVPEYVAKAAVIRRLVRTVAWPAESFPGAKAPLVVAVIGPDPFGPVLEQSLGDAPAGERRIHIERYAGVEALRPCHLLFVARELDDRVDEILAAVAGLNVLTVGEHRGFAARGGMVELVLRRERIRLVVDTAAAAEEGLALPAELVALGARVE